VNASSIVLNDASVVFQTQGNRLFGVGPSRNGGLNLAILYGSETTAGVEPLSGLNAAFLQIGEVSQLRAGPLSFGVSNEASEWWFVDDLAGMKSLLTVVTGEGAYSIFVEDPWASGHLVPSEGGSSFSLSGNLSFFAMAQFVPAESRTPTASMTPSISASLSSDFAPSPRRFETLALTATAPGTETDGLNLSLGLPASGTLLNTPPMTELEALPASLEATADSSRQTGGWIPIVAGTAGGFVVILAVAIVVWKLHRSGNAKSEDNAEDLEEHLDDDKECPSKD
jgi:hypothetical protein